MCDFHVQSNTHTHAHTRIRSGVIYCQCCCRAPSGGTCHFLLTVPLIGPLCISNKANVAAAKASLQSSVERDHCTGMWVCAREHQPIMQPDCPPCFPRPTPPPPPLLLPLCILLPSPSLFLSSRLHLFFTSARSLWFFSSFERMSTFSRSEGVFLSFLIGLGQSKCVSLNQEETFWAGWHLIFTLW